MIRKLLLLLFAIGIVMVPAVANDLLIAPSPYGAGGYQVYIGNEFYGTKIHSSTFSVEDGINVNVCAVANAGFEHFSFVYNGLTYFDHCIDYVYHASDRIKVITVYFYDPSASDITPTPTPILTPISTPKPTPSTPVVFTKTGMDRTMQDIADGKMLIAFSQDLNSNGEVDPGDLVLMKQAVNQNKTLYLSIPPEKIALNSGIACKKGECTLEIPEGIFNFCTVELPIKSNFTTSQGNKISLEIKLKSENNAFSVVRTYLPDLWTIDQGKNITYNFGEDSASRAITDDGRIVWWQLSSVEYPDNARVRYFYNRGVDSIGNEVLVLESMEINLSKIGRFLREEIPYIHISFSTIFYTLPDFATINFANVPIKITRQKIEELVIKSTSERLANKFPVRDIDISKITNLPKPGVFVRQDIALNPLHKAEISKLYSEYLKASSFEKPEIAKKILKLLQEEVIMPDNVKEVRYIAEGEIPRNIYKEAMDEVVVSVATNKPFWSFTDSEVGAREVVLEFDSFIFDNSEESLEVIRATFYRAVQNAYDLNGNVKMSNEVFNLRGYQAAVFTLVEQAEKSESRKIAIVAAFSFLRTQDWMRMTRSWAEIAVQGQEPAQKAYFSAMEDIMEELLRRLSIFAKQ